MLENLFATGFVLALLLPPAAVVAGAVLLAAPRFHPRAAATGAAAHS